MKTESIRIDSGKELSEFYFKLPLPNDAPITLFKAPAELTFANNALNIINCLIAYSPDRGKKEIIPIEIISVFKDGKLVNTQIIDAENEIYFTMNNDTTTPFGGISGEILISFHYKLA